LDTAHTYQQPGNQIEALIMLYNKTSVATLQDLRQNYHIRQIHLPRLAIAYVSTSDVKVIEKIKGVQVVYVNEIPLTIIQTMTPAEKIFANAWQLRKKQDNKKERPGDQLPWDTEGFDPPGKPK